jgi:multiple sugar transport system permease protein
MPDPLRRRGRGRRRSNAAAYVILSVSGFVMVFPFLYQLSASFMSNPEVLAIPKRLFPGELRWWNYTDAISRFPFWDQLRNTALMTAIRTISQVVFSALAGYAFARLRFPGNRIIFGILLSILMIPGELLLISQYQIISALGWLNSIPGLVAPGLVSAFGTFMMRQLFLGLPRELEEAARIDGAGPLRTFAEIMLPLAAPAVSALTVISLIDCWGAFLWPLVVNTDQSQMTLTVGLATFQGEHSTDYGPMMAAALIIMLPMMILFILMQRRVVSGLAFSGLKG